MIPVIGSVVMGICSGALFWATTRLGRDGATGGKIRR
jgi:hypothetical protein